MKLEIAQKALAAILTNAYKAISNKPKSPIMACFLLQADVENQKIVVTSSNGILGIKNQCNCKIYTNSILAVNASLFTDVILSLHDFLNLEIVSNQLVVTHSTGKCRLAITSPEDFPSFPVVVGKSTILTVEAIQKAFSSTLPFAAYNEIKQILAAIHLKLKTNDWEAAATDGHRLGVACSGSSRTIAEFDNAVTIPYSTATRLSEILSSCKGDCQITIGDNNIISFELLDICVTSRLLNDTYPNYRSLIPTQFNYRFIFNKKSFASALSRVATLASQTDRFIQVTFNQGFATLYAESPDVGGAVESVAVTSEEYPDNFSIGFNIKYLAEAIKAIVSDEIVFKASAPNHPVILAPIENLCSFALIMPVQLKQIKEFTVETNTVQLRLKAAGSVIYLYESRHSMRLC
jgi:DNA polymerase-3 subunit beta